MAQKKQIKTVVEAPLTKVATEVPIDVVAIAGIALACVALLVGVVSSELSLMQGGAGGGASSTPAVCIEDKFGKDYFQAGYAYGYNTSDILATATDKCYDIGDGKNDYVQEYFCTDAGVTPAGRKPYITVSSYHCLNGCSGGACVTLATNTTPTITPLTFSAFPGPSFANSKVSSNGVTTANTIINEYLKTNVKDKWPLLKFTVSNMNSFPVTVTGIKFSKYGGDLSNLSNKFNSFLLVPDNNSVSTSSSSALVSADSISFNNALLIPANTISNITLIGQGLRYDNSEGKYFIFRLNDTDISVSTGTKMIANGSYIMGHINMFMDYLALLVSNGTGWNSTMGSGSYINITTGNYIKVTTSQFVLVANSNSSSPSTISITKLGFVFKSTGTSTRPMVLSDFDCDIYKADTKTKVLSLIPVANKTKVQNNDGSFTMQFYSNTSPLFKFPSTESMGYVKCTFLSDLKLNQLQTTDLFYDDLYASPASFNCSNPRSSSNLIWYSSINPSVCYDGTYNLMNKMYATARTWTVNWK